MMSIAIMQPYIFPYIGYFQLVYAADVFVFYDDVNFINRGWVNRNRILLNGRDQLFTISCADASQNRLIKDILIQNDPKARQKLLATIHAAYSKAPQYASVYPLIESIVNVQEGTSIADMAVASVVSICDYLGVKRSFKRSSEHHNNRELKKADRLIDICHIEGIGHYINAAGGKEIYTKEYFAEKGIKLDFMATHRYEYPQFRNDFVPWLSIIDILMFNDREDIVNKMLPAYHLD